MLSSAPFSAFAKLSLASLVSLATLLPGAAHADVVFNWVQTGTPSPINQHLPFAVMVSDETYWAALSGPVTFGSYFGRIGVEQTSANYLQAQILSSDVAAAVRVISQATGDTDIVPLAQGLATCNTPPWFTLSCRVGFASATLQANEVFTEFFTWGGGMAFFDGTQSSSFTLNGHQLSTSYTFSRSFGDGATMSTDSTGVGSFALLSDGSPSQLRGTGVWEIDASTIPVPLPPSAWLMGLGLLGVLSRARSKRR